MTCQFQLWCKMSLPFLQSIVTLDSHSIEDDGSDHEKKNDTDGNMASRER